MGSTSGKTDQEKELTLKNYTIKVKLRKRIYSNFKIMMTLAI